MALAWGLKRRGYYEETASLAMRVGIGTMLLSVGGVGWPLYHFLSGFPGLCGADSTEIFSYKTQVVVGSIFTNVPLHASLLLLVWAFLQKSANWRRVKSV